VVAAMSVVVAFTELAVLLFGFSEGRRVVAALDGPFDLGVWQPKFQEFWVLLVLTTIVALHKRNFSLLLLHSRRVAYEASVLASLLVVFHSFHRLESNRKVVAAPGVC
jgi:hypothetical protein